MGRDQSSQPAPLPVGNNFRSGGKFARLATHASKDLPAPRGRPVAAPRPRRLRGAQRSFSTSSSLTGGARLPQALRR